MKQLANVPELHLFMGMTNQLGKFFSRLAEHTQPLRELLSKKNCLAWGLTQESAFSAIKTELSKPTILGLYDSVLLQKNKKDIYLETNSIYLKIYN